jgi:hypothetical protein
MNDENQLRHLLMITKVFITQLVQSLFEINWFVWILFVNSSREKRGGGKKKVWQNVTISSSLDYFIHYKENLCLT